MSLGYIGLGKFYDEDEKSIYYVYSGENWNNKKSEKDDRFLFDGLFRIDKSLFERFISGEKMHGLISSSIELNKIEVLLECKNCFRRSNSERIDYLALGIIFHIFDEFKETGIFPKETGFIQ